MKKVLAVIVNYGTEQLDYLKQVIAEFQSFEKYEVDIVVHTNVQTGIEGIEEVIFKLSDYQYLPLTCRKRIWEERHNYNVFIYTENDHLFKEFHIDKHLEYTDVLPFNRISGLIQYEVMQDNSLWFPAYHANYKWERDSVEVYEGKVFAHFTNVHQASFILTKTQLLIVGKKNDFTKFFGNSKNYSVKCRVNTDVYQFGGMKKLICISEFDSSLIHHLPNLYADGKNDRQKLGVSETEMKAAIKKLLTNNGIDLIQQKYEKLRNTKSDINEHLETLKSYAEKCNHITEAGVRWVVSTWALLAAEPKKLISYDIKYHENIEEVKKLAKNNFEFRLQSFPDENMEETDLLFIDTWHTYSQLKKELEFANKARRFIILHDTTTFGKVGEDGGEGLKKALSEFLKDNKEWRIKEEFTNNNGLTVLERFNTKYSVIIPTMWYANSHLFKMLDKYQENDLISEILIINNRNAYTLGNLANYSKIRVLNDGKNLFVNPSWNLGVKEAKEQKIIIANDDINIPRFDEIMTLVDSNLENRRVLGFHEDCFLKNTNRKRLEVVEMASDYKAHGFGVFMCMFKSDYAVIPDDIKVWSGDRLQITVNTPFAIKGVNMLSQMSTTSKRLDLQEYRITDSMNYKKLLATL